MNEKVLILKAMVVGTEYDYGPSCAVIELTPSQARWYLRLIQIAGQVAAEVEGFCHLEVFDYAPTWYQYHESLDDARGDAQCVVLDSATLAELCGVPVADLADQFATVRQETTTVVIDADGVHWTGYVKHTDPPVRMETKEVSLAQLRELAQDGTA